MRRTLLTAALAIAPLVRAQAPAVPGVTTLEAQRDQHRVLLIFAQTPDDPQLQIQLRTLSEHAADASERDLVPIAVVSPNPSPTATTLTAADADAARHRFQVPPPQFTVILLGKDGGEKLRSLKPISMRKLASTIDAMPMRQDEMRERHP